MAIENAYPDGRKRQRGFWARGDRAQEHLAETGVTLEQLAGAADVTPKQITRVLANKCVDEPALAKIAAKTGLQTSMLARHHVEPAVPTTRIYEAFKRLTRLWNKDHAWFEGVPPNDFRDFLVAHQSSVVADLSPNERERLLEQMISRGYLVIAANGAYRVVERPLLSELDMLIGVRGWLEKGCLQETLSADQREIQLPIIRDNIARGVEQLKDLLASAYVAEDASIACQRLREFLATEKQTHVACGGNNRFLREELSRILTVCERVWNDYLLLAEELAELRKKPLDLQSDLDECEQMVADHLQRLALLERKDLVLLFEQIDSHVDQTRSRLQLSANYRKAIARIRAKRRGG